MRITFLTGCLEHGNDGVGDYTRLLAQECVRRDLSCQVVALADPHVHTPEGWGEATGHMEIVRLPRRMRWSARLRIAARAVTGWAPDWVSLQFVPYSYHRWGLAGSVVRALPRLAGGARLHLMLHEIWIGGKSWRARAISAGQRRSILWLGRQQGMLVHTSNQAYQQMLGDHGIDAGILPLFGSVPVASSGTAEWLWPALARAGCHRLPACRRDWWLFVLFGTLHPIWPPEPLLGRLFSACQTAGKRMALVSVGRLGAGESLWKAMEAQYASRIPMLRLGQQPESRIAELLQAVDFGVATSPYTLLGKSATVAAMLDHGLPVIVNREDGPRCAGGETDPRRSSLIIRMNHDLSRQLLAAHRLPPEWRLAEVAEAWLTAIGNVSPSTAACSF